MAKVVRLTDAIYNNIPLKGDFHYVRGPYLRASQKRDCMFKIIRDGEVIRVHVFNSDFQILDDGSGRAGQVGESLTPVTVSPVTGNAGSSLVVPSHHVFAPPLPPTPEEIEVLGAKIDRRFRVMAKLTEGIIQENVRALIMSGAAGIGKSFNLEKRLKKALADKEINKYTIRKGRISAVALYAELYMHQDPGDVLVLDDNDIVFQDEVSLNLLKGALDTGESRPLAWKTASTWLEENGIEDEFEFNGCCVFVTNLDFDRMIERGSVLAPHFKALLSRSIYLDLLIHTPLEIMIRIEQVVKTTPILDVQGIDDEQKDLMMNWLWDNYEKMRELSLRSVLKIGSFMNTDMSDWEEMCQVTMVKAKL